MPYLVSKKLIKCKKILEKTFFQKSISSFHWTDSKKSSTLLDLATFDTDADAVLMWHCGVSPRHFANEDGIKWVDHSTLGRKTDRKYGIAGDQVFKPQSSTTTYLGNNAERILILNSEIFNHNNKGFDGTRGWFKETKLNRKDISLTY